MKNIFKFIVLYVLLFSVPIVTCYAGYSPGSIKEDNTKPEATEEFYTNDSTAFMKQLEYELQIKENWENLSDEDKEMLAEKMGISASDVSSSLTSRGGKNAETVTVAESFDLINAFMNPNVLNNDFCGPWKYSENIYEVRMKEFPGNFTEKYTNIISEFLTDKQYKLIYDACKYLKWDFLALVAKWNYQSGHCYILEHTSWGPALGYAGQLAGESDHTKVIQSIFTQDEIAKGKGWTRCCGIKNSVTRSFSLWNTWVPPETVKKYINEVGWNNPEIEFLCSTTGDDRLDEIKLNVCAMIEMRLVVAGVAENGKHASLSEKDGAKLREIAEKDTWSEEDIEFLFGDLLEEDTVYKKYDSLPKYKQKAYLFFKHWSGGSSDSGQTHYTIKDICNYIENSDFNKDLAETYLASKLALNEAAGLSVNGYEARKNLAITCSDCTSKKFVFYNARSCWVEGYDISEYLALLENQKGGKINLEQALKVVKTIDEKVYDNDLAKGLLFVMSGFMEGSNPKLNPLTQDVHGLFHAGARYQLKFMGQPSLGCSGDIGGQESVVLYFPALDWYLFDYNLSKQPVP